MRSWRVTQLGEPVEALRLCSVENPVAGEGQLLIKVDAAAVNFADLLLCRGGYQERPECPFSPGLEVAGTVAGTGAGTSLPLGTHVIALPKLPEGGYQQLLVADEADVFALPDAFPAFDAAALHVAYATAHIALHRRAGLKPNETLLVHGAAGGVGSAAVELGVAAGARVFATVGGPEKVAFVRALGAHVVIDHRSENFVEVVNAATGGAGADVVFDPVGGAFFDGSRRCINFEGRLLIVGFAGGEIEQIPAGHVLVKNYSAVGVHLGYYRRRNPQALHEAHDELLRYYAEGKIQPRIFEVCSFEDLPRALALVENRSVLGKVVLDVSGEGGSHAA